MANNTNNSSFLDLPQYKAQSLKIDNIVYFITSTKSPLQEKDMQAIYAKITEVGKVELQSKKLPELGKNELLLEAHYSTLSPGTEQTLMAGHILPLPQDIGYSMAAIVKAVGEDVNQFKVGDAVVTTGQHASFLIVNQHAVTPVPKGVPLEQAAFFNLAHTALYAIRRTGIQLGEPAIVMGQGLVGAITAQLAKLAGASPLIVTDIDDTRLTTAKALGIDYAINSKNNPEELNKIVEEIGMGGVPVIFEATGLREPLDQAFELVSERGRVMMMSPAHSDTPPNYSHNLMMKGATLIGGYINSKPFSMKRYDLGFSDTWPPTISQKPTRYVNSDSFSSDEDIRVIMSLIKYGKLDLAPLISHRFTVDEIPKAYQMLWNKDMSLVGGVINWQA